MPAGTKFCLHGIKRDDAMYMHSIDNDIDFYEILSEKEKRRNPKMSRRLGGFSFFITEKQIEKLPIHFISGSRERSLEILKLYRQKIGITE